MKRYLVSFCTVCGASGLLVMEIEADSPLDALQKARQRIIAQAQRDQQFTVWEVR